jgi:hypothetical protein
MRTIYKSLFLFVILFLTIKVGCCQPANLFAKFGAVSWNDYPMSNRGVTMAVTVQSVKDTVATFLYNTAPGSYNPKWCGSTTDFSRSVNKVLYDSSFYYTSGSWDKNLNIAVTTGKYYTFITSKRPTANNTISILETAFNPVNIASVTQTPLFYVDSTHAVSVTVKLSGAKNAGENVFVRYTTNNWSTSNYLQVTSFNPSNQGTVIISKHAAATIVSYYALTTMQTVPVDSTMDYYSLKVNNNSNLNYTYTVTIPSCSISAIPALTETNLNGGTVSLALINTKFTDATLLVSSFTLHNAPAGTTIGNVNYMDSVHANIILAYNGTYFGSDSTHVNIGISSVELDCGANLTSNNITISAVTIGWCNLQFPAHDTIVLGTALNVYARIYVNGITNGAGAGAGIQCWIGYNTLNTNPDTWTNWVPATFNIDVGNDDEYVADIGSAFTTANTYYYASRFKLNGSPYSYGGYYTIGGGFWDGNTNVSGKVLVNGTTHINEYADASFSIWPNPANIVLNIDRNISSGKTKLSLLNILGQEVYAASIENASKYSIDISMLPKGTYIVRMINDKNVVSRSIIIQ